MALQSIVPWTLGSPAWAEPYPFRQLHSQFVTASYLWLDTENCKALYSAAGHPPLLRWRGGKLERIAIAQIRLLERPGGNQLRHPKYVGASR